jgi:putative ABC transport system substrate-binding protein
MKRREFIKLLGGSAAAWPLAAGAQQLMPLVGFLGPALDRRQHWLASFRTRLGAEGFTDGRNVRIEYRSADGGAEGLPALAADLVQQGAAVIVALGHRQRSPPSAQRLSSRSYS